MARRLYPSIKEMTRPHVVSDLVNRYVPATCLVPFETKGWSSTEAEFLGLTNCNGERPRYIIKRLRRDTDWVMAATDDRHWRSITVWQQGLLDRLPEEIDHGVIACSIDEDGYAILMHNVSQDLVPDDTPLSEMDNAAILEALAALHAAFWEDSLLGDQKYNLCKPEDFFSHTSPLKARRIAQTNPSIVLDLIIGGRHLVPKFVETDLAQLMHNLVQDPAPLCTALARYPRTLVHSDVRLANLGLNREERPRLIMLDWARQTPAAPAVDLAYYLVTSGSALMPITFEQSIDLYKQQLARRLGDRFDESWWQPQLELCLLGTFATMACFKAWGAEHSENAAARTQEKMDLQYWAEQARSGVKWLA
jgi:hypothetical protein